ncbi:DUF3619 family protein [Undibacterium sp. RTI2.1]|uniref:DUF3619 family protein n=1 Tax=unclassified Undibacterium TaxID=2630295 RepID=UPI002AB405A6|nr:MULTISPECIES: DUF3619 family protein [unclassified Undibacterium]MDY7538449.1 DUF3619 family protein [Undibacterium sp. 5I1]MEB0030024.1 DUF3619 family protein [Undibacterium sp. RTI2.1]MEB0114927.1 DUF3619 family protein [Undibacterium sp. RTI2.2]MEB0230649.1 DUF3619 family protein [Undibacterium sp. 10I3]MEB0255886.1 DUF3619 family protein [Undibacterium sp. 5I1]
MNYSREAQDLDFAYKVRHALNESAENIPAPALDRLANARKIAMSRKKQASPSAVFAFGGVLAGNAGFSFQGPQSWLGKLGVILPLLVLVMGLTGIYEYEQQRRISDLAEIDAAVLVDELPPDAYLDTGFSAYLNKAEE